MNAYLLRAFRHPLILASIALLALNDHLLKYAAPSWLTGKLSDFAGLFFFPFVLGALWQVGGALLHRRASGSKPLKLACFAITGLVFTGVKTLLAVNAAVTALFPYPAQIALDPADLIALLAFWPAWTLWGRLAGQSANERKPVGKWTYLALGAASLASLATAPCPSPAGVIRLASIDGALYGGVTVYYGQETYTNTQLFSYVSTDQGKTWSAVKDAPPDAWEAISRPAALPITVCDPANPRVCFRISKISQVEASRNGGQSWQVSWQIPPGRGDYMDRAAGNGRFMACAKTPNRHPFDLLFVPGESGAVPVIAWGNEGVLRLGSDGAWERVDVDALRGSPHIGPTAFYARDLSDAMGNTGPEFYALLLLGILVYLAFSLWAWIAAGRHPVPGKRVRHAFWPMLLPPLNISLIVLLMMIDKLTPGNSGSITVGYMILLLVLLPVTLLASLFLWRTTAGLAAQPGRFPALFLLALGAAAAVFGVGWLPFITWAFGVIAFHTAAVGVAAVLELGVVLFGGIAFRRGLRRALA